jgi:hypothetical protein
MSFRSAFRPRQPQSSGVQLSPSSSTKEIGGEGYRDFQENHGTAGKTAHRFIGVYEVAGWDDATEVH